MLHYFGSPVKTPSKLMIFIPMISFLSTFTNFIIASVSASKSQKSTTSLSISLEPWLKTSVTIKRSSIFQLYSNNISITNTTSLQTTNSHWVTGSRFCSSMNSITIVLFYVTVYIFTDSLLVGLEKDRVADVAIIGCSTSVNIHIRNMW